MASLGLADLGQVRGDRGTTPLDLGAHIKRRS